MTISLQRSTTSPPCEKEKYSSGKGNDHLRLSRKLLTLLNLGGKGVIPYNTIVSSTFHLKVLWTLPSFANLVWRIIRRSSIVSSTQPIVCMLSTTNSQSIALEVSTKGTDGACPCWEGRGATSLQETDGSIQRSHIKVYYSSIQPHITTSAYNMCTTVHQISGGGFTT